MEARNLPIGELSYLNMILFQQNKLEEEREKERKKQAAKKNQKRNKQPQQQQQLTGVPMRVIEELADELT